METPKKRKTLSISDKVDIIRELEKGSTNSSVCKNYELSSSTVSTIWKNRESVLKAFEGNNLNVKKMRTCEKNDIDEALFEWFKLQRDRNIPISGPILQNQAEKFATDLGMTDFKCSNGWLGRFKKRHNISCGKVTGEANSVDYLQVNNWLDDVWNKVKNDYKENDVFNIDETGVFYNLMPDKTLKFKGEKCIGGKLSKERVTVLIGANMTGTEKRKLLVIGKSKQPRCFKHVKTLPVKYEGNKRAWMTSELFSKELRSWDATLRKKNRKILVLVDNCPAHCKIENLTNINLMFLPPNVTSVLQPMDQGIIRSFKCHFRKLLILKFIEHSENKNKISVLQAIRFMAEAWNAVTEETIKNCFKKSGIFITGTLKKCF